MLLYIHMYICDKIEIDKYIIHSTQRLQRMLLVDDNDKTTDVNMRETMARLDFCWLFFFVDCAASYSSISMNVFKSSWSLLLLLLLLFVNLFNLLWRYGKKKKKRKMQMNYGYIKCIWIEKVMRIIFVRFLSGNL